MSRIKSLIGMAWASPPVRTAIQVGLGAVFAAAASDMVNLFDGNVWRTALAAATAAGTAKLQAAARA